MGDCYICRQELGEAAERFCRCPGETGQVHGPCLSAWLTRSMHSVCRFCGTTFVVRVQRESLCSWLFRAPLMLMATMLVIFMVTLLYFILCIRILFIAMVYGGPNVPFLTRVWVLWLLLILIVYGMLSLVRKVKLVYDATLRLHPREEVRIVVAIQD